MLNSPSVNALRAMSLDAIRGFESAARHLSFTAAAEELFLTQSAVSKQVKSLENSLGKALFLRGGKGLSLTPEGRQLFEAARTALAQLASAVDGLLAVDRVSVSVTTTPSFAALWLAALFLGLDHTSGFAINIEQVVGKAKTSIKGKFAQGYATIAMNVGI